MRTSGLVMKSRVDRSSFPTLETGIQTEAPARCDNNTPRGGFRFYQSTTLRVQPQELCR